MQIPGESPDEPLTERIFENARGRGEHWLRLLVSTDLADELRKAFLEHARDLGGGAVRLHHVTLEEVEAWQRQSTSLARGLEAAIARATQEQRGFIVLRIENGDDAANLLLRLERVERKRVPLGRRLRAEAQRWREVLRALFDADRELGEPMFGGGDRVSLALDVVNRQAAAGGVCSRPG